MKKETKVKTKVKTKAKTKAKTRPLPLAGQVALVAGATRGTGRGIAVALGELGATVYCTGRSVRGAPASGPKRPETIEETAELVTAAGGRGIAVRCDHSDPEQVDALVARVKKEAGRIDVLVNDIWGGEELVEWGKPFWALDLAKGRLMLERAVGTHVITAQRVAPLMRAAKRGLIVEVTDGDHFGYRGNFFYDLAKMAVIRLAFVFARELRKDKVVALAITPGFLRSEAMLDLFGVSEANWRDAVKHQPDFIASETPLLCGRAVAALAAESPATLARRAGRVFSSWDLARQKKLKDADGTRPDWGAHFSKKYGPWPSAGPEAYASWFDGPFEVGKLELPPG